MERTDASRPSYAQHHYATPQSQPVGSLPGRSQYASQPPQLGSTQLTPHYSSTPQQPPTHGSSSSGGHYDTPASLGRYRGFEHSPAGLPMTGRQNDTGHYGFNQTSQYTTNYPLPAQALHFSTDLRGPDAPRQPDTPHYQSTFGADSMYNLTPASTQPVSQPAYEHVSHASNRSNDTVDTFPNPAHYGVPPPATGQFYLAGQALPPPAPASVLNASHVGYDQSDYPTTHAPAQSAYVTSMMTSTQPGPMPSYPAPANHPQPAQLDLGRQDFGTHLRTVFTEVDRGALRGIDDHLLSASTYLLTNIETLRKSSVTRLSNSLSATYLSIHEQDYTST